MATITTSLLASSNSIANYNNWAKTISDALTSFGIIKTSDVGQVNWTTNTLLPASNNAYPTYEIRTFTDSLSSTHPVVFKIWFGPFNNNFPSTPGLRFTFGSGSDGNGNITHTSNLSNVSLIPVGTSSSTTNLNTTLLMSGSPSRFQIAWLYETSSVGNGIYVSVERTKSVLGADTNLGLLISAYNGTASTFNNYYFPFIGGIPPREDSGIFVPPSGTGNDNTSLNIYPNTFFKGGTPILGIGTLGFFRSDVGLGTNVLNVLGANHTYYFLSSSTLTYVSRGNILNTNLAMLFE